MIGQCGAIIYGSPHEGRVGIEHILNRMNYEFNAQVAIQVSRHSAWRGP